MIVQMFQDRGSNELFISIAATQRKLFCGETNAVEYLLIGCHKSLGVGEGVSVSSFCVCAHLINLWEFVACQQSC